MSKRRYKYWVLRSPSGDLYRTYSLSDFVKAHPEEFPNAKVAVHGLYIGSAASGWIVVYRQTMDGEMIASPPKKNRNFWTLRSPSGEVYGVSNLRQFLRDHPEDFPNIDTAASAFTQVTGTARTVRGWSVLPDSETSAKVSTWSPVPFCRDCGRELTGHIRVTRCPECQKEANRRNNVEYRQRKRDGKVREIGSTAICEACGEKYTVESGSQRYCKACSPAVVRENCRKKSREQKMAVMNERSRAVPLPHTCTVCGNEFYAIGKPLYCSDECRQEAKKQHKIQYDLSRREKHREYDKKRYAQRTPEQKEQRNAKARERWANRTPEQIEKRKVQDHERYLRKKNNAGE